MSLAVIIYPMARVGELPELLVSRTLETLYCSPEKLTPGDIICLTRALQIITCLIQSIIYFMNTFF